MNKALYWMLAGTLLVSSCRKDKELDPVDMAPIEEPIIEAPLIPIGEILDRSVITNASNIDEQFFCPDAEIEIGVTTDLTVERIDYHGLYISGVTGDTTIMWTKSVNGLNVVWVSAYDALEAVIIADVFALEGNDRTPGVKPRGYDFPAPLIEHEEHPVLCSANNYSTTLRNGFPGAASIKWTKDYEELVGENGSELVVNSAGVYDIKTSYEECPKFFQAAGGVEVVYATATTPQVTVSGTTIEVVNYDDLEFATLELLDVHGNLVAYNGYTNSFQDVVPGSYIVRASFWGNEFYMGLGDIGRVSVCNAPSDVVTI
jgi:hypothetical protein